MEHMFEKQIFSLRLGTSSLQYAIIPWDSNSLDNTTVEIENFTVSSLIVLQKMLERLQLTLHLKKGDLLFSKIPLKDNAKAMILDRAGFYWIEVTITLDIDLSTWKPARFTFSQGNEYRLLHASNADKQNIRKIAGSTFVADRFHLDPAIPKARADHRFEMWIENSFRSSDTLYKFVNKKNTTIGFFIVNEHPDYAEFRLAGLHPKYVSRGLGKMLYHRMYALLKRKKYTLIKSVISLNNIRVMNVYMYLGHAKFINPLIALHKVL